MTALYDHSQEPVDKLCVAVWPTHVVVNEEAVSQERVAKEATPAPVKATAAEQKMLDEFDSEPVPPKKSTPVKSTATKEEEWVEDEEGNFVKKGD